jgi:hypothetical protein
VVLFYVRSECPEWVPFAVSAARAAAPLTVEVVAWLVLWSVSSWITVGLGVVVGWCVLRGRVLEWWSGPPALSAAGWTEDDPAVMARRRTNAPDGGRPVRVGISLTVEEAGMIAARAAELGLTASAYVAQRALSEEGSTAAERRAQLQEVWALQRELSRVADVLRTSWAVSDAERAELRAGLRAVVGQLGVVAGDLAALGVTG